MASPTLFRSFRGFPLTPIPRLAVKRLEPLGLVFDCCSGLQNATHRDVSLRWRYSFLGDQCCENGARGKEDP